MIARWLLHWRERVGLVVPPVQPGSVWVHASSVGEVAAVASLVARLPPPVLLTTDTDTGLEAATRLVRTVPALSVGIRPLDLLWTLAPLLSELRPRALLLAESVSPPVLSRTLRAAGVPVIRVSGRVGPRSRRFGRWWAALARVDLVLARDAHEAAFFGQFGPVLLAGDGKLAGPAPVNPLNFGRPYVVGVSTREGDEARILDATTGLVVLAPRDLARVPEVEAVVCARGLQCVRRSALLGSVVPVEADVLLVDTFGDLAGILNGARVAVIGGSFAASPGAHSPAEAIRAGTPVIAGPFGGRNEVQLRSAVRVDPGGLRTALAGPLPPPVRLTDGVDVTLQAVLARLGGPIAERTPRPWAAPLAPVLRLLAGFRRAPFWSATVPVLAVGSANARGPGRTSFARWLAEELRRRGFDVGVSVRGYRRVDPGSDVRDDTQSPRAADLGDEGALFAADGHRVAAGPDRRATVERLLANGATVIVLDDGLGSHPVRSLVDIEIVDARFPTARGPLPAGERRPNARPGQVVVWTHVSALFPAPAGAVVATARPGPWVAEPPSGSVAAFAGLGRSADIAQFGDLAIARFRALRDHQGISDASLDGLITWADGLPLVTTAKDAVRLPLHRRHEVNWRDVTVDVENFPEAVWATLAAAVSRPGEPRP